MPSLTWKESSENATYNTDRYMYQLTNWLVSRLSPSRLSKYKSEKKIVKKMHIINI